jgi:hypothetical protein
MSADVIPFPAKCLGKPAESGPIIMRIVARREGRGWRYAVVLDDGELHVLADTPILADAKARADEFSYDVKYVGKPEAFATGKDLQA